MPEPAAPPDADHELLALKSEVARQQKIIRALMDRAERSTIAQSSDFSLFQTTIQLEEKVQRRTAELEAALHDNERINRALRESEAKFRGLVSQSLVGIVIVEGGRFSYSNSKFNEMFGYSAEEASALGPLDLVCADDRPLVAENIRKRLSGEVTQVHYQFRGLRKNGAAIDIELYSSTMDIGGRPTLISLLMDVTERTRAAREVQLLQEQLREQSIRDPLTGLYNRRYLEETLSRELELATRQHHSVSVVMGDLDHFKSVNDRYGHLAGDEVLRYFGKLLQQSARASDIYCRYGGEEFLLLLPQMSGELAVERAEHLRQTLASTPVPYAAGVIPVTASFGVAAFPGDGTSGDDLIAAADQALYAAKEAGRNRVHLCRGPVKA
jgi:diguanylate cyclase (GGDEF)-like protein/PAS domain S-box-containing protein